MKPAENNTQDRRPVSEVDLGVSQNGSHREVSAVPASSGHANSLSTGPEDLQSPNRIQTEEVMRKIASNYLLYTPPQSQNDHDNFLLHLQQMRCTITGVKQGSLVITVKCDSLEALERLWEYYLFGHLNSMVQRCFVTEEILTEFNLAELKLKTTILEEEYKAYKAYFEKESARG